MKRPMEVMAVVLILGLLTGRLDLPVPLVVILSLLGEGMTIALVGKKTGRRVSRRESRILFCCLPAVFCLMSIRSSLYGQDLLYRMQIAEASGEVTGTVSGIEEKNDQLIYTLSNARNEEQESLGKILLYFDADQDPGLFIGQEARWKGRIRLFSEATNEGQFDSRTFHACRKEVAQMRNPRMVEEDRLHGGVYLIPRFLYSLRQRLVLIYNQSLPGEEPGLLSAMALGDRSDMSEDSQELFRMAGIIHLMSVSGTHIGLVSMFFYRFLRKRRLSFGVSGLLAGLLALFYGTMCGNSIPTIRAVGSFLVMALSQTLGRAYDGRSALSFMAMLQLIDNPMAIQDTAFLFSYGAVFFLLSMALPIQKSYQKMCRERWEKRHRSYGGHRYRPNLKEYLFSKALLALAIQFVTLPLVAALFYEVPVYVFLLNLILLPLFPVMLFIALIGGLINLFLPIPWILLPCHILLYFMEATASISLRFPFARIIVGYPGLSRILIAYLAFFLLSGSLQKKFQPHKLLCAFLIALIFLLPLSPAKRVDMLDCGQGLAVVVKNRAGTVFVDGGSSDVQNVGQYRLLPYLRYSGIRRVDYWILTHLDDDHVNGFMEVLSSDYPISYVCVSPIVRGDEKWKSLEEEIRLRGSQILYVEAGDQIHMGHDRIRFFYPPDGKGEETLVDRNNACLSFLYETEEGNRMLFLGDLEENGERAAMVEAKALGIDLSDVEVLQAAHHGADGSNSKKLLELVKPREVLISAGKNNKYGHPGKEARARIEHVGADWDCTIWEGRIRVHMDGRKIRVESYKKYRNPSQ